MPEYPGMLTKIEGIDLYAVLSLSGCLTVSVVSHARGREFREFKEYRGV